MFCITQPCVTFEVIVLAESESDFRSDPLRQDFEIFEVR